MMPCPACGTDNPQDARFCARCGAALFASCAGCGTELPPAAAFCPSCGTPVAKAEAPSAGDERKLVTVLFADIAGSTGLAEALDPERLKDLLNTYFEAMRAEIEAEGGTVEKFIGDAVVAAFGVPVAHEDDPARALRAAVRMRRRLEELNPELGSRFGVTIRARIGVNTGEVLAATVPEPGEAMVTGDAVNVAARLEQAAEPGAILASERTARGARGYRFGESVELNLRGKDRPVRAFELLGDGSEPERGVPGLRAPMIGRKRELALLESLHERSAEEDRPNLVTIYGDPGVGKSRLTHEFLDSVEARSPSPAVVRGRCLPYGEGVTYWPLAEILKGYADVLDTDPPQRALGKIRAAGRDLLSEAVTADPARSTAALAYTVGVEDPDHPFRDREPREVREEITAAWRSFFSALALRGSVVAVIEDIHWADPALLDLLENLAERVRGGVLFLCPARPDLTRKRPDWGGGRRNFSSIALEPLEPADADRLISLLLSIDDLPTDVHRRVLERAEGNPFFLEEIVRQLIDQDLIVREDGRWRATETIGDVEIPDTVQGVLAARIDLLEAREKRALQCAAVVGRVFWPSPVGLLLNGEGEQLREILRRLEERELVSEQLGSALAAEREYIFKHILTRDVAYESLPRRDRARAHRVVADWIEATSAGRQSEFVELLAYHYATAVRELPGEAPEDLRAKAYTHLLRASRDALSKLVLAKAQRMAEEAVALATDELERSIGLEALAESCLADYQGDLAWRYFCAAADARLASARSDGLSIAYLCARAAEVPTRWAGSMRSNPTEREVARYLQLGFSSLPPGDSEERVRLQTVHACWPFAFPDYEMSFEDLLLFEREGLEAAETALRLDRPNLASGALDAAPSAAVSRGLYGRGFPIEKRRLPLVPRLTDALEIGDAYATSAWGAYELGLYAESESIATEGIEKVRGRARNAQVHGLAWRSSARYRLGDWDGTLSDFREMQELLGDRREEPPYFATNGFVAAGLVCDARGQPVEADAMLAYLLPLAQSGAARLVPWIARLLIQRGALEEAHRFLDHPRGRWRMHAGPLYEARLELAAAEEAWAPGLEMLDDIRTYAMESEVRAPPLFADRFEGRAALVAGDADRGLTSLARAASGFERIGAQWEEARTELLLAEALRDAGRPNEARARLEKALPVFERLSSVREAQRARELEGELV